MSGIDADVDQLTSGDHIAKLPVIVWLRFRSRFLIRTAWLRTMDRVALLKPAND